MKSRSVNYRLYNEQLKPKPVEFSSQGNSQFLLCSRNLRTSFSPPYGLLSDNKSRSYLNGTLYIAKKHQSLQLILDPCIAGNLSFKTTKKIVIFFGYYRKYKLPFMYAYIIIPFAYKPAQLIQSNCWLAQDSQFQFPIGPSLFYASHDPTRLLLPSAKLPAL